MTFMNAWVSAESGALPVPRALIFPPNNYRILENTKPSYTL